MKLLYLSIVSLLGSLFATAQTDITNPGEYPPEFSKGEFTLIVRDADINKVSEYMPECFAKNYGGKYKILPFSQAYSQPYADPDKYRYEFVMFTRQDSVKTNGSNQLMRTTEFSYGVYDRKTSITYRQGSWAGDFKLSMINYVKKLENLRKTGQVK